MIIREHDNEFIMIRQHDHAVISEQIITKLREEFLPEDEMNHSLLYAIKMHDFGWRNFDAEPLWNDEKKAPFSFIDLPNPIKTVLYKYGIDEVAKEDLYAGMLCSKHYSLFLANDPSSESQAFVANEEARQRLIKERVEIDEDLLSFHFELLKLADDLSLFVCLHEPGAGEDDIHYFFENGIRLPQAFKKQLGESLQVEWLDRKNIRCLDSPFQEAFTITIPLKKVSKETISAQGLRKSYQEAETKSYDIIVQ